MAMQAMLESLRSGDFVTRERMRLVGLLLVAAFAAGLAYLAVTANGLNDTLGRPLGTDFSNVYAAGTYVREGNPEAPFDPRRQYAREQAIFGAATPFYGWHYPPFFLFIAAALAMLPYIPALLVWQGVTLALYLLAIRAIVLAPAASAPGEKSVDRAASAGSERPVRLWLLLAVAYPAVFVNLGHGHNGLLTGALIGTALAVLDRRPIVAGILFGLLVYKPQFGILIPLVLVATGRWKTFGAAAVTVAALVLAAILAFGLPAWDAFLASAHFTRNVVLESGETGWHKIQSVFALVRMWGGPVVLAYAVQSCVTVALAAALVWLWRLRVDFALKAAALVIAAILATPYSLDYDLTALAPAIAFLAVHGMRAGFAPYEKSALAAMWLAPLIARAVAQATLVPLGLFAMAGVLCLILRRAWCESAASATWHSARYPVA
jgi:alpha-1,2-mannosyltransferase